jgi:Na+-transporting methylmalonyl-CoA/oxaloacetate decarboxylase gamma subunit
MVTGIKQWLAFAFLFLLIFVLPIKTVDWLNNPASAPWAAGNSGQVLAATTDNSGRYQVIPVLNFPFDTHLHDPATISFLAGVVLLVLAIVIIAILFYDFRKREQKYNSW